MYSPLTPDGAIVLSLILIAVLCVVLWILLSARKQDGIAYLPSWMMFGNQGVAVSASLIIVLKGYDLLPGLIRHERRHQEQMRRDGLFTFWGRYLFSRKWRREYEIDAFREWVREYPKDLDRAAGMLSRGYDFGLSISQAREILRP